MCSVVDKFCSKFRLFYKWKLRPLDTFGVEKVVLGDSPIFTAKPNDPLTAP